MSKKSEAVQAAKDAAAVTRQAVADYGPGAPETIGAAQAMVATTEAARTLGATVTDLTTD